MKRCACLAQYLPKPSKTPTVVELDDEAPGKVLGYDADRIARLREADALG
jgi:hypothetical protein